jgi:hypothetical protein
MDGKNMDGKQEKWGDRSRSDRPPIQGSVYEGIPAYLGIPSSGERRRGHAFSSCFNDHELQAPFASD